MDARRSIPKSLLYNFIDCLCGIIVRPEWKLVSRGVTREGQGGRNSPGAEKSQQCHMHFLQHSTFASEGSQV